MVRPQAGLHSDHLGSASLATDYTGVPVTGSETRYTPWGEVRTGGVGAITDRRFTSQTAGGQHSAQRLRRAFLQSLHREVHSAGQRRCRGRRTRRHSIGSLTHSTTRSNTRMSPGHDPWWSETGQRQDQARQNARGYFWNGSTYEFRLGQALFRNVQFLNELLAEAGFTNQFKALNDFALLLGQVVADIAFKVGGTQRIKTLFGGGGVTADFLKGGKPTRGKASSVNNGDEYTGRTAASISMSILVAMPSTTEGLSHMRSVI